MSNVIFSQEDCEYIKSFWNEDNSLDGNGYGKTTYNNKSINIIRDVRGHYIDLSDASLLSFILNKVSPIGIGSISLGQVKIAKYIEGDYFSPHKDYTVYDIGTVRKTVVVQLSAPTEYDGGNLLVEDIPQSRELGSASIFNSNQIHEITRLTRGVRYSLVMFLIDGDYRTKKTII